MTNGGTIMCDQKCNVPGWGNKGSITNIISMAKAANKFKITFKNENDNTFVLHNQNNISKFKRSVNKLYFHEPITNTNGH